MNLEKRLSCIEYRIRQARTALDEAFGESDIDECHEAIVDVCQILDRSVAEDEREYDDFIEGEKQDAISLLPSVKLTLDQLQKDMAEVGSFMRSSHQAREDILKRLKSLESRKEEMAKVATARKPRRRRKR